MKPSIIPKFSASSATLILIPFALIAVIFFVVYPNEFKLQSFITTSCSASNNMTTSNFIENLSVKPDFRLLLGILTVPDRYERRNILRLLYSLETNLTAHVDVRFIFCKLEKEDQHILIALEIMKYNDIIILDCKENMNDGKTYTYFSTLPKLFNGENGDLPYDYVFKADDDTYFRLPNLIESMKPLSRQDLYYGFVIPCESMDPFKWYMSGMGYALSWDIVEWISTSEIAKNNPTARAAEDDTTGVWLRDGNKGNNRFNTKFQMYDYPLPVRHDGCEHDFMPDTIGVHRLKDNLKWARTLKYLNVTSELEKKTKFYDLDCGECVS